MSKKNVKYSQAMDELNSILADLETEKIDVDDLTSKVKRATELIQLCRQRLEKTEMEVKKIVKEFEDLEK